LILRPPAKPPHAPTFNLAAAVAVARAIEEVCGIKTDIKWPNDVLINGKKCCGILTEMNADLDRIKYLVVGIGINVNHESFPETLQEASSLFLEGGRRFSRIGLILAFLLHFESLYFESQKKGTEWIVQQWMDQSSFSRGREISVDLGDRQIEGTTWGLGKYGTLRVRLRDGGIEEIMTGDIVVWK
jgi:BirA family biotin operon repressor/biotin-[acetyl-CoA-carboxylase] ligase